MSDLITPPHTNNGASGFPELPKSNNNLFNRLKELVLQFIAPWNHATPSNIDPQLTEDVKKNAIDILFRLNSIKEDLRQNVDQRLFTHVEDVVDPIASRIKSISKNLTPEKQQVQAFDQWMQNKVKPLVDYFASKSDDREAIANAVVAHVIEASAHQIETDLKVINDDQMHKLGNLDATEDEKHTLEMRVEQALSGLIKQWRQLKTPPQDLTIEKLTAWKADIDSTRTKFYHVAMDIIDSIIPDADPNESVEMHEHLLLNFKQMAELEEEIPTLFQMIADGDFSENIEGLQKKLAELDSIAHQLHQELRLTPELVERLSHVENSLQTIRQLLSPEW